MAARAAFADTCQVGAVTKSNGAFLAAGDNVTLGTNLCWAAAVVVRASFQDKPQLGCPRWSTGVRLGRSLDRFGVGAKHLSCKWKRREICALKIMAMAHLDRISWLEDLKSWRTRHGLFDYVAR